MTSRSEPAHKADCPCNGCFMRGDRGTGPCRKRLNCFGGNGHRGECKSYLRGLRSLVKVTIAEVRRAIDEKRKAS